MNEKETMMMHAHVYFEDHNKMIAKKMRIELAKKDWCLFVGPLVDKTIGPHTRAQFEIHFLHDHLIAVTKYFTLKQEGLSILVHKVSLNDWLDHTENCFWLGPELKLDYSKLETQGENKAIKRFADCEALLKY